MEFNIAFIAISFFGFLPFGALFIATVTSEEEIKFLGSYSPPTLSPWLLFTFVNFIL